MLYQKILKSIVPIPRLEQFDSYLFVGPHPDDVEIACAPTIAKLISQGKKVIILIATDGSMGTTDKSLVGEKLAKIRYEEAKKSADILGAEIRFLGFNDGGDYTVDDVSKAITRVIVDLQPQVVVCPDPKVISESHPDHIKVAIGTTTAFTFCGFWGWSNKCGIDNIATPQAMAYYFTDRPNTYVNVRKFVHIRAQTLACHHTQFDNNQIKQLESYFMLRAKGLKHFLGICDAYRVLAPIHMHCFPESSKW